MDLPPLRIESRVDVGGGDAQEMAGVVAVVDTKAAVVLDEVEIQPGLFNGVWNLGLFNRGRADHFGIAGWIGEDARSRVLPDEPSILGL